MNVLITRPEPQATLTYNKLMSAGFAVISEPCQIVKPIESVLQPAGAYIITSQKGVDHGLKHVADKDAVIFAVGDKTAQAAEDLGFNVIFSADGDSQSLVEVILSRWEPDYGNLLHLSGAEISTDISALLSAIGYSADRTTVYEAVTIENPSKSTIAAINNKEIDTVLFYSAQAVTIFNQWMEQAGLEGALETMQAIVMSDRIAQRLGNQWKSIKIAESKHEDALIKLLNGET